MRWLLLLVVAGCSAPPGAIPPAVPRAEEVQPGTVHFTVTPGGGILREGVRVSIEDMDEVRNPLVRSREPKLIRADAGTKLATIGPLLFALITKGNCVNIAFLVTVDGQEREVPITVEVAHCCSCLFYFEGAGRTDEHDSSDWNHLWIGARAGPLRLTELSENHPDSIYFPPAEGEAEPPRPPPPAWAAEPKPEGSLTVEGLRAWLDREAIRSARPVVMLDLLPEDNLAQALEAIVTLRAARAQVVTSFRGF